MTMYEDRLTVLKAERDEARAELNALADSAEPYGECNPDCDCNGHEGPRTCDCHITGTEARARIESLVAQCDAAEAELESQHQVVEAARAIVAELKRLGNYGPEDPAGAPSDLIRSDRWPFEVALVAAIDILDKDMEK